MTTSIQSAHQDIFVTISFTESAEHVLNFRRYVISQPAEAKCVTETAFFIDRERFKKPPILDINDGRNDNILQEVRVRIAPLKFQKRTEEPRSSRSEGEASASWNEMCRICHAGASMGNLLSPCDCRGSIALTHMICLERWLKESANSHCELCNHHFQIIRSPRYSVPMSILVFLRHPGEHLRELMLDLLAFCIYTPSAVTSTYILMLICESVAKYSVARQKTTISAHIVACSAIVGMAAIDFTYSSWLMLCFQKHQAAWRQWYKNNCKLKVILPEPDNKDIRLKQESEDLSDIE